MNADEIARGLERAANLRALSPFRSAFLRGAAEEFRSLQAQLAASQRREQAAVDGLEDLMGWMTGAKACALCTKDHTSDCHIDRIPPRCEPKWRGSQEAGEESAGS